MRAKRGKRKTDAPQRARERGKKKNEAQKAQKGGGTREREKEGGGRRKGGGKGERGDRRETAVVWTPGRGQPGPPVVRGHYS